MFQGKFRSFCILRFFQNAFASADWDSEGVISSPDSRSISSYIAVANPLR